MKVGVILPHTKLYGGVKRFFELGDVFNNSGHDFVVFTVEGIAPSWYTGSVTTQKISALANYTFQAVFITETQFLEDLSRVNSRHKIFYFVRASDKLGVLKKYPDVKVFANSTNGYEIAKSKYGIEAFKAFGGINTTRYFFKPPTTKLPEQPFVVMAYGRIVEKKKGTKLVVKACEKLFKKGYNIRLLLFDTPVNEKAEMAIKKFKTDIPFDFVVNHPVDKNVELYHRADIFVAAEKNAGHSNTAAEAMASGLPVIGTTSGTKDFLIHNETGLVVSRWSWRIRKAIELLINDTALREKLAYNGRKKVEQYSWEALGHRIIEYIKD